MTIALDAMGGDLAPAATVEGALRAHRERGLSVVLVGDELRVREELRRRGAGVHEVQVHHASQVVEMDEHPGQALRKKKDSSIRVGFDLCKAGQAAAMVSAGNSGAVLAGGLFVLGRLDHVDRSRRRAADDERRARPRRRLHERRPRHHRGALEQGAAERAERAFQDDRSARCDVQGDQHKLATEEVRPSGTAG